MTPYEMHQRDLARGYEPYPYAHLLHGAPLFTWTGWLSAQCKRVLKWLW